MVADKESNFVYISGLLKGKCPTVFEQLTEKFIEFDIKYDILPHTKDLWVVDFMPLQISKHSFVLFKYDPDYLKPKIHQKTKSNVNQICKEIGIATEVSNIVLDGGNIVKGKSKVILTSKVFKENPGILEHDLILQIQNILGVEQVIIIPQEPKDFIGHSDGMVRFVDENTVLINQYPTNKEYQDFGYSFRWSLRNAGLHYVELPYDSWKNKNGNDATGNYINFLEIDNCIFYPYYGVPNDQWALIQLQKVFADRNLIGIDCRQIAVLGGVLNCATWNILRN